MDCHIEIFYEGQWLEAAQASFSDIVRNGFRANNCVFEYDLAYAFGDAPLPVSPAIPVDADRHTLQAWPTFLYDLVPQGNGRRFLLDRLQLPDAQAWRRRCASLAWTRTSLLSSRPASRHNGLNFWH